MQIFWAGDACIALTQAMYPRRNRGRWFVFGWAFILILLFWFVGKALVWFCLAALMLLANVVTIVLYPLFWGLAVVTRKPRHALAGRWAYVDDWFRTVYYRAYR